MVKLCDEAEMVIIFLIESAYAFCKMYSPIF